jgi:signal transduction histidine kinase
MTSGRGLPIAAHLALLVAIALIAAHVAIFIVVVLSPARPAEVARGDVVLSLFAEGYAQAAKGQDLAPPAGATWRIRADRPVTSPHGHSGLRFARAMIARSIGVEREKVFVDFRRPPRDVIMRVRDREREWGGAVPPASDQPPVFDSPRRGFVLMSAYTIAAELPDGRWLVLRQRRDAEAWSWIARLALSIGGTMILLLLVALVFARRLAAPISRFASAVERVGLDAREAPVPEAGPRELRSAARAVNAMQARLQALVAQRTEMLATVAHDLRTPLMRLRLAADGAEPALQDKIAREAAEIDGLVGSFIAFARDDPTREARVKLDLAALVQSIIDDRAAIGQATTFDGPERLVVLGQPIGLKRVIDNLVDNAVKYGVRARVSLALNGGNAIMSVEDDGPGIAAAEREAVFRPFVRGTASALASGAGLGLSAAREIARAHGGDVDIEQAESGGARLIVRIPAV